MPSQTITTNGTGLYVTPPDVFADYRSYYANAMGAAVTMGSGVTTETTLDFQAQAPEQLTGTAFENALARNQRMAQYPEADRSASPSSINATEPSFNLSLGAYMRLVYENMSAAESATRKGKAKIVEEPSRSMLKRVTVEVEELDLADPRQKLASEAEALLGYQPLRRELRAPGTLRRALAKLEITVFDEASVNRYKEQMADHYRTNNKMLAPTWRLTKLREYKQPVPEFVLQKAIEIKRELPEAEFYIDQLAVDPFLIVSLVEIADHAINCERELDSETAAYVEVWAEPKFEATM